MHRQAKAPGNDDRVCYRHRREQLTLKVRQCDFFRNLIIFDKPKVTDALCRDEQRSEGNSNAALQGKRPDDYVGLSPKIDKP